MTQTIDDNGAVHDRRGRFAEKPSMAAAGGGAADLGAETMLERRERESRELHKREFELRSELDAAMIAASLASQLGRMDLVGTYELDEDAEPDEDGEVRPWVIRWRDERGEEPDDYVVAEYVDNEFGGAFSDDGGDVAVTIVAVDRGGRMFAEATDGERHRKLAELPHWNGGDTDRIEADFSRVYDEHAKAKTERIAATLAARLEFEGGDELTYTVRSRSAHVGDTTTTVRRLDDDGYEIKRVQQPPEPGGAPENFSTITYRPGGGAEVTSSSQSFEREAYA